jgi:SIR2-like domain
MSAKEKREKELRRFRRERPANLDRLAGRLIARHLRISVPDKSVRTLLAEQYDRSVYPDKLVECNMRCVAVVGAGASAPLLARGNQLAKSLERKFGRDKAELERLRLVNNLKKKHFETRLIALSRTPEAERKVRETIANQYSIRYPPLLANELLAHLLKHRFLDAVVSFNFDELLDQSIDDELGPGEYVQVVSERDCANIQTDPDKPDYIPLYVKLHGTASEPESLRFTPDSYYAIPDRVSSVVADVLESERCVLLNVGSGLTSFDFQRLISSPERLEVFNLSKEPLEPRVCAEINERRRKTKKARRARSSGGRPRPAVIRDCATEKHGCDAQLKSLVSAVQRATQRHKKGESVEPLVQFRSVLRHEAVVRLLRNNRSGGGSGSWNRSAEARYLERRTILELALAGAKARGLLSLKPLSEDRSSRYFERYQRLRIHGGATWRALCSSAGLEECEELPDVLVSRPTFRKRTLENSKAARRRRKRNKRRGIKRRRESQRLHEVKRRALAKHVIARIVGHPSSRDLDLLVRTIGAMQRGSEIELHTQDDRVCSKAFRRPATLKTITSLHIYTWLMLRNVRKRDRVYICAETGAWLLRSSVPAMLRKPRKMRSLQAFDTEETLIRKHFPKQRLKLELQNPWHHNRHMTVVCRGKEPDQAIYFARHQRNPIITAVYLSDPTDVRTMKVVHRRRWKEAKQERKRRRKVR